MKNKQVKRYFDLFEARTSNRLFILIIGARGLGKSFAYKDIAIGDYLKRGWRFILIRRYMTELDTSFSTYLQDIQKKYPEHLFEARKDGELHTFYCDGEPMGYAISLSRVKDMKSIPGDTIFNIGFDEFLPEDGKYITRGGNPYYEVDMCLNIYDTVCRGYGQATKDNVRFYFLANATDINNPYFHEFKLTEKFARGANKVKTEFIYAELPNSNDYTIMTEKKNSKFGRFIAGTHYGGYALDNNFYNDSNEFIVGKLPGGAKHLFNIISGKDLYGVWYDNDTTYFYVTDKYDPKCKQNYALNNMAHKEGTELVEKIQNYPTMKLLRDAYNNGYVMFKDSNAKFVLLSFLGVKL